MVKYTCENCGDRIETDGQSGTREPCPGCGQANAIPQPTPSIFSRMRGRAAAWGLMVPLIVGGLVILVGVLAWFLVLRKTRESSPQPRIEGARKVADSRLLGQIVREEAERQQKQEEAKLAAIRATIKGGAWLAKKAGNSEVLRGLKIHVLKASASPEDTQTFLAGILKRSEGHIDRAKLSEEHWARAVKENPGNNLIRQDYYDEAKAKREAVEKLEAARKDLVGNILKSSRVTGSDINLLYGVIPQAPTPFEEICYVGDRNPWAALCEAQCEDQCITGIDGTYEIQVSGGKWYLFAQHESDYSVVEWFVPLNVRDAATQKVDFYNETAAFIRNKETR